MSGKICSHTETTSDTMVVPLHSVTIHFCHILASSDNKKMHKNRKIPKKLAELSDCLGVFSAALLLLFQAMQLCKLSLKLSFITMAEVSLLFAELLLLLEGSKLMLCTMV